MDFLGINIGNVGRHYKIEKDGPNLALSAQRSGRYAVLGGHPVNNVSIAAASVIDVVEDNGGPDGVADGTTQKSILKDNTEAGSCSCIGFMLVKIVWTTQRMVSQKVAPPKGSPPNAKWQVVTQMQPVQATDYIVTTAYNVARESSKDTYTVHNKDSKGGQVHTEQICAYRLRAFLDHLKTVRDGNKAVFDFSQFQAEGTVKFRGKANSGGALSAACNGCKGVWTDLRKDYPFLVGVDLAQD